MWLQKSNNVVDAVRSERITRSPLHQDEKIAHESSTFCTVREEVRPGLAGCCVYFLIAAYESGSSRFSLLCALLPVAS